MQRLASFTFANSTVGIPVWYISEGWGARVRHGCESGTQLRRLLSVQNRIRVWVIVAIPENRDMKKNEIQFFLSKTWIVDKF